MGGGLTTSDRSTRGLPYYPVDLYVPASGGGPAPTLAETDPRQIAYLALGRWNAYLRAGHKSDRQRFLDYVSSLINAERRPSNDFSVWPTPTGSAEGSAKSLSAGTQGAVASALLRAHLLLNDATYRQTARRALQALETEILDGGVGSVIGADGFFFEDLAVYPAPHILSGFLVGLIGLYEYVGLFSDPTIDEVIQRSMSTLHSLMGLYDTGYWSRVDLLEKGLATTDEHRFHVALLRALAGCAGCDRCAKLADRWATYQERRSCRVRRALAVSVSASRRALARATRRLMFPPDRSSWSTTNRHAVCIVLPAFPVAGGTRAIVTSITNVMADVWNVAFLTHVVGPHRGDFRIEQFGTRISSPWQFPNVWFYAWAGLRRLASLVRRGNRFRLILPQDGSYTAVFAAIVGKASGARVVSVEHGTLLFPFSSAYRAEMLASLQTRNPILRLALKTRLAMYWPSLQFMERLAARLTDQFLVQGDEIEQIYCQRLGVHPSQIVRFLPAIDTEFFKPLEHNVRNRERARFGFAAKDLLLIINGRLSPEKGLDVAVKGIAAALAVLPRHLRDRVRLGISGSGPSHSELEGLIQSHQLDGITSLLGEAHPETVAILLGIADVYLYTSVRGANTAVSVLEAMAAGCAVVASDRPQSHTKLLAGGRGIAIPAGDVQAIKSALTQVLQDPHWRADMGQAARSYIRDHYSPHSLRRALLRATYYPVAFKPRAGT